MHDGIAGGRIQIPCVGDQLKPRHGFGSSDTNGHVRVDVDRVKQHVSVVDSVSNVELKTWTSEGDILNTENHLLVFFHLLLNLHSELRTAFLKEG